MSTDETSRRQRVVMALGIATIILFSANLLTVLAKHFWPDHSLPFLSKQEVVVAEAPMAHFEVRIDGDRSAQRYRHRIVLRAPHGVSTIHLDELDRDIADMEAAANRLERELNQELSAVNSENIMRLELDRAAQKLHETQAAYEKHVIRAQKISVRANDS